MLEPISDAPNIVTVYLQIAQYPILAQTIRQRMREELFRRGIITEERLEAEVEDKAVLSQQREGLIDPYVQEDEDIWLQRKRAIRDHLTDFYFAYNLPLDMLLTKAQQYEAIPEESRTKILHHLEEIIVVLIKTMISDQLGFIRIAKGWFSAEDFQFIRSRRIGNGKIGGKAAGMLLAYKIMQKAAPELARQINLPDSYFIGADVFYDFISLNNLEYNQKYRSADEIRAEYPDTRAAYEQGRFPEEVADRLRAILERAGKRPLS